MIISRSVNMKDFPEEYEREQLDEMYAALVLPEEQVSLLKNYFDAFGHFYQRISLRDAYDIFRRHNGEIISREDFISFSEIVRHEEKGFCFYFILAEDELFDNVADTQPIDREIVAECLVVVDEELYYQMRDAQADKPLYVPEKEELLKYADDLYYRVTPELAAMEEFLIQKVGITKDRAADIIGECALGAAATIFPDDMIEAIEGDRFIWQFKFTDFQREEFLRLAVGAVNNMRHPCNRGFTPLEMTERYGLLGENTVAALSSDKKDLTFSDVGYCIYIPRGIAARGKIGRNDPCPCGSGKKYKKCCMRSGDIGFN